MNDFLNDTLKQKDFDTLYKFSKCHRSLDDLLAVNNDEFLEDYKHRIYPPELQLNCEDKSDQKVNYLDLHLEIKNSSIEYCFMINGTILDLPLLTSLIFQVIFLPINLMESSFPS
jgi:hypothetical protein